MIPDLRARLKAASDKPKAETHPCVCRVYESRTPLAALGGPFLVSDAYIRRLGLAVDTFDLRRALFIDTETTGLRGAGTVAFLVGLGWVEDDSFVVRQLLMRDYPEETPMLTHLAALLPRHDCLISFNGKSFDLPLLRDRFIMARLKEEWRALPHLDLLHAARRTWKLRLGSCTLGALEAQVLGIAREGDLPGAEVPERYYQFLKCGDQRLLDDVLRHNEQDIRTLYSLLGRLCEVYAAPETQADMLDIFSIGRALDRYGEGEMARRCFHVASVSTLSRQARLQLARSYRRDMDYQSAADTYRSMIDRGEADPQVYTALAILLERRLHDVEAALDVTEMALRRFSGGHPLCSADAQTINAFTRRYRLLSAKSKRQRKKG